MRRFLNLNRTSRLVPMLLAVLVATAGAAFAEKIQIENASPESVTYSIRRQSSQSWSESFELDSNKSHTFTSSEPLVIGYWTDKARFTTLEPNKRYRLADARRGQWQAVVETLRPAVPPVPPVPVPPAGPTAPEEDAPPTPPAEIAAPAEPAPAASTPAAPAPSKPAAAKPAAAKPTTAAEASSTPVNQPSFYGRELKVIALADDTYRRIPDWKKRIRTVMAGVSTFYESELSIRFTVVETRIWTYRALEHKVEDRWSAVLAVEPHEADLVIGFVGLGDFRSDASQDAAAYTGLLGRADFFAQHAMVSGWSDHHENREITTLIHELGHVFGAFHVADPNSVMQPGYDQIPLDDILAGKVQFGKALDEVLMLTRHVDLQRGVSSLSETARRRIQEICREHRIAGEADGEDPITAGFRYRADRAKLLAELMAQEAAKSQQRFEATAAR